MTKHTTKYECRLLVTSLVPEHWVVRLPVSQAGNKFCMNLHKEGVFSECIASLPLNVPDCLPDEFSDDSIHPVQCRFFPHHGILRYLNAFLENFNVVSKARKYNIIWFYNVTRYNFVSYCLLKYFFGKRINILLADFAPAKRMFSIETLLNYLIKYSDSILSLSSRTAFRSHQQFRSIAGFIPMGNVRGFNQSVSEHVFLFSGMLDEPRGLSLVLETFSRIPEAKLIISGRGDTDLVVSYTAKFPNINFVGFLEYADYLDMMDRVTVCLSLRDPSCDENEHNFPSKILEYLTHGKKIVSTMEYPELQGIQYANIPFNVKALTDEVKRILNLSSEEFFMETDNFNSLEDRFSRKHWNDTLSILEINNT